MAKAAEKWVILVGSLGAIILICRALRLLWLTLVMARENNVKSRKN